MGNLRRSEAGSVGVPLGGRLAAPRVCPLVPLAVAPNSRGRAQGPSATTTVTKSALDPTPSAGGALGMCGPGQK